MECTQKQFSEISQLSSRFTLFHLFSISQNESFEPYKYAVVLGQLVTFSKVL